MVYYLTSTLEFVHILDNTENSSPYAYVNFPAFINNLMNSGNN